ncbi:SMC domain-containing protein [Corynebacterium minutissimum]|uniref:SMC domain-containing protein n=2 Tax=Corynebacterium minutissimum TaxID=38301 RepID=A0A376D3K5_9CORY|nr:SMC domain-containing protein [Corynebacterium minutissimum]
MCIMSGMSTPRLAELRLRRFKSFHDAVLTLHPVTFLTGLNSSGKSNALDGLEVLSRLSSGSELSDALDGRMTHAGPIRGGSRGCAPHGEDSFELGCTVEAGKDIFRYDVEIQVLPELRVLKESLVGPGYSEKNGVRTKEAELFKTQPAADKLAGIYAEIFNGKRGANPETLMRDSRLILGQVKAVLAGKNRAENSVLKGASIVSTALRSVFHLDPVPSLMRNYVAKKNAQLKRSGENLSAVLWQLRKDSPETFRDLGQLAAHVTGVDSTLDFIDTQLDEVMLTLVEHFADGRHESTPAREMSDGLLRFLAIATALKTAPRDLDIEQPLSRGDDVESAVAQIVVEEMENGLHPSQAQRVMHMLNESAHKHDSQVLVTTHSPAILDQISGETNGQVAVCYRDEKTGNSELSPLVELPDFVDSISKHSLGAAVTAGELVDDTDTKASFDNLNKLFGIG